MPQEILFGKNSNSPQAQRVTDRLNNISPCQPDVNVQTMPNRCITKVYQSGSQAHKPDSDFADQAYGGQKE
jgi:hypothetical protein